MADKYDNQGLLTALASVLTTWPLYRPLEYTGAESVVQLPRQISQFCKRCGQSQNWNRDGTYVLRGRITTETYTCRNCEVSEYHYYFRWEYTEGLGGTFTKLGQHPELDEEVSPVLEKVLGASDTRFLRRAVRCRNFGFGVAALAYLRRVVESTMNNLLDEIASAAREVEWATEDLKRLADVKASRVFDDKVSYGAAILPPSLRPGNSNPMELLHGLASEGLHNREDEECCDMFDECRGVLEYVVVELSRKRAEATAYLETVKKLNDRRAKRKGG